MTQELNYDVGPEHEVAGIPLEDWYGLHEACPYCGEETVGEINASGWGTTTVCYSCEQQVKTNRKNETFKLPEGEREVGVSGDDDGDGTLMHLSRALTYGGFLACITIVGIPLGLAMIIVAMVIRPDEEEEDATTAGG